MSERIATTSQFTMDIKLSTDETKQSGLARIISLSEDPYKRNFTIWQIGRNSLIGKPLVLPVRLSKVL
ncbi:MAG: hypothetical protein ACE5KZ_15615, partial [Candidatus Scalinduaceae bacterium]